MENTQVETKLEEHEFEQFKKCINAVSEVKTQIADNAIQEQSLIADKPRLMLAYNKSMAEFEEFKKQLKDKYGEQFNINLSTGVITYQ